MFHSPIVFTRPELDRVSHRRDDAGWLADAFARDDARLYLFAGDVPLLKAEGNDPLWTPAEAGRFGPGHETAFLGLAAGAPRFARRLNPLEREENGPVRLDGAVLAKDEVLAVDLRSIVLRAVVAEHHLNPLAEAKALLFWHQRHCFCANCGAPSAPAQAGWRRDCPACKAQHFPRTDPVVIMLAIDGDRCLMGRQRQFAPKVYSSLAGFMEPGETIEDAVRREIFEEAGIETGRVRQLANQPWPFPSSLMIACFAEAKSRSITMDTAELEDCRWFSREDCRQMLAATHPDGLLVPPVIGISNYLIRAFIAGEKV